MSEQPYKKVLYEGKEIFILGTAHVSRESCDFVKEKIHAEQPDIVCIELCEERLRILEDGKKWENTDLIMLFKQKKLFFLLVNVLLSSIQERVGKGLGVKPGEEFLTAIREAKSLKIPIVLIDRSSQITLKRVWNSLGFFARLKLFFSLLQGIFSKDVLSSKDIELMKEKDNTQQMIDAMEKFIPNLKHTLISERDIFMAKKISEQKNKKILAVVGAGHLSGMEEQFKKKLIPQSIEDINVIQKVKFNLFIFLFKWFIPIFILYFIGKGFGESMEEGVSDLVYWVLINGVLSSLGVIIAKGRFVTVLIAFIAAPITSLIPMIGVSYVTGLVELYFNKPTVKDLKEVKKYINYFSKWRENRFTQVLLVTVLSGLGSTIGTYLAGYLIIT